MKIDPRDIRLLAVQGLHAAQIAKELGVSLAGVSQRARRLGIELPKGNRGPAATEARTTRIQRMADMHRQGLTLQQIGDKFGVTRERVRQLLASIGVTRVDGGKHQLSQAKCKAAQSKQDARSLVRWGLSFAEYAKLRDAGVTRFYCQQQANANRRGIEWKLNLSQWWALWQASGKWEQRGRAKGSYVMSRIRDSGCYEIGNVHVQLLEENSLEAVKQWRGKTKANRGVYLLLAGTDKPYQARVGRRSLGFFATEAEAVQARADFAEANGYHLTADGRMLKTTHPPSLAASIPSRLIQEAGVPLS